MNLLNQFQTCLKEGADRVQIEPSRVKKTMREGGSTERTWIAISMPVRVLTSYGNRMRGMSDKGENPKRGEENMPYFPGAPYAKVNGPTQEGGKVKLGLTIYNSTNKDRVIFTACSEVEDDIANITPDKVAHMKNLCKEYVVGRMTEAIMCAIDPTRFV